MPINNKQDFTYLWDMREAAREIVEFLKNVSHTEFEKIINCATRWKGN